MIVTLLTDFGTADYFVAAIRGVILSRAPGAAVVDVTHEIEPQDVGEAAFTLGAVYRCFPAGTVHLAVVDPGVGSERRPLVVAAAGQLFVGPDNGLFTPLYRREPGWRAFHVVDESHFRPHPSTTFHGRDIFAPVAAALARGVPAETLGPEIRDPVLLDEPPVERAEGGVVRGAVVHVDRFGNCVTNLGRAELEAAGLTGELRLDVGGRPVSGVRRFYAEAPEGEPFAIWGSAELLEVAVNRGSAAALLGARRGTRVTVRPG